MSTAIYAPMAGKLLSINVNVGDKVEKDDEIATLEAMKMELQVFSTADGTVASIDAVAGSNVTTTTVLVTLE